MEVFMYTCIRVAENKTEGVATITISREEKRNALSPTAIKDLSDALRNYSGDPDVQVLVLTGAGSRVFCAGADFGEAMGNSSDSLGKCEASAAFANLLKSIRNLTKPIVARVNGHALGGGFGLASACDIVIAADDCQFGTPEVNVGLFPWMIMPVLLAATPYRKRFIEMVLTGGKVDAKTAMELGFVNHVVSRDQLDAKVSEIAGKLADKSPRIARIGRHYFYNVLEMDFEPAIDYGVGMLSVNMGSEEATEGVTAFLEKRKPVWKSK
jgi:enoyl-CoA hydratase